MVGGTWLHNFQIVLTIAGDNENPLLSRTGIVRSNFQICGVRQLNDGTLLEIFGLKDSQWRAIFGGQQLLLCTSLQQ